MGELVGRRAQRGASRLATGIDSSISADGETVGFVVHTTDGDLFLDVALPALASLITELTHISNTMLIRQHNRRDKGREALEQIIAAAPMVCDGAAVIDDLTGDVSVVFRFADRPPTALRASIETTMAIMKDIDDEIRMRQH